MDKIETLKSLAGKKIFVTGHTGFKGAWLTLFLDMLGAKTTGFALPPESDKSLFSILNLDQHIHHIEGDIRNRQHLEKALSDSGAEVVLHLAAQSLVRKSYLETPETFDTNVMGSVNLLEAVRKTPSVKSLIFVTSDKCYKNKNWTWGYRETDELGGHDPYSASKAAAELIYSSYVDSIFSERENFGSATVRAGNVVGGGDWAQDRIVPDCMRSFLQNEPVYLRNPDSIRTWQFVLEPLVGYLTLAALLLDEPKKFSGAWNFGPEMDSVRTVRELVGQAIRVFGKGKVQTADVESGRNMHEAKVLKLSIEKSRSELNWKPLYGFEKTVETTVSWYKEFGLGGNMAEFSRGQISRYLECI